MRRLTPFALTLLFSVCVAAPSAGGGSDPLDEGLKAARATEYDEAKKLLESVRGAGASRAKLALARVALERGRFDEADKLAAGATGPEKAMGVLIRAESQGARGNLPASMKLLRPLITEKGEAGWRARILLGEALLATGKRSEAEGVLRGIIDAYNNDEITSKDAAGLTMVGRAAHLMRSPKDANQAYNEAERAEKNRVDTLLYRAELFLDAHDPGHAEETTREALTVSPNRADAIVMMARIKLEQTMDFDEAEKLVKKALEVNPKHSGAWAVRAGLAMRDMNLKDAEASIQKGLAQNPADLELLSLSATARFLADDPQGFEAKKKIVLGRNPEYSTLFSIVGEYAEWEHRYDDIIQMMDEATKIDPEDGKAWAGLGLTLLRTGREDKGLEAIRTAFRKDKFNVRVFNTLNLYEKEIPQSYSMVESGIFKVRLHNDDKPLLGRYVPALLGEAWASMKARYGYVPKVPVQVELYTSRQQFSVRTSGLPNIGIQGVCFGGLVAAISPSAEPFNWGNVLWHELGHVFAIQISKNHVPRWFTEGLSEYETIARRPEWARQLDPELFLALKEDRLPKAVDMNRAFTHAADASDMTVAYYASSQLLVYTVERFGMPKVVRALELWGEGKKTPEVIQQAFGVSPDAYDAGFRTWAMSRLSRYEKQFIFRRKPAELDDAKKALETHPNDAGAKVDLILAELRSKDPKKKETTEKLLTDALGSHPTDANVRFVAAKLSLAKGDAPGARTHLDAMRGAGHDGYVVRQLYTRVAAKAKDERALAFHLEAAHRFDPSQKDPVQKLFALAEEQKRPDDALGYLRKLTQIDQHSRQAWAELQKRLDAKKAWAEAATVGEGAVFVDAGRSSSHTLYAHALSELGDHEKAAFELESALLCPIKKPQAAKIQALLEKERAALGQKAAPKK